VTTGLPVVAGSIVNLVLPAVYEQLILLAISWLVPTHALLKCAGEPDAPLICVPRGVNTLLGVNCIELFTANGLALPTAGVYPFNLTLSMKTSASLTAPLACVILSANLKLLVDVALVLPLCQQKFCTHIVMCLG